MTVTIVDYGMGNIRSIENALVFLGVRPLVTADPDRVVRSSRIILPGVGSFARAITNIDAANLRAPLLESAKLGVPLLGICLGMQLLASSGDEDGPMCGLGLIPGNVVKLTPSSEYRLPHIGFNSVEVVKADPLVGGPGPIGDFYFVHSYSMKPVAEESVVGRSDYGGQFVAAVSAANVHGVQFHPEKSQTNGIKLLQNFLSL